ncbi:MAG: peptide chain release factor N(5)-glutamine methyltransferase [Burkholderiaceae bacterium]|nr:peptide chain release factor N(5)-glutamine methyltransferase [Burkholderiaceae bacterium]
MNNIHHVLHQSSQQLVHTIGLDHAEANLEANLLLKHVLHVNRAWVITHDRDVLNADQQAEFQLLLKRRLDGEPIAYIVGFREFYGLQLKVSPVTLIPRPDTETLVDAALEKIPLDKVYHILDLGTGTGAVALAIAKHRNNCEVTAVDQSSDALSVTLENAQSLKLNNLRLIESNWFSELQGERFDLIVSNPPYIAQDDEHLKQGDLRFEPISALASGVDGLDDIRKIVQDAPDYLKTNGWLMLEHGFDQAEAVAALLSARGFNQIDHAKDIAGTLRVTFGAI